MKQTSRLCFTLICFLSAFFLASSQKQLGIKESRYLSKIDENAMVNLLVKGELTDIASLTKQYNGRVNIGTKNVSSVVIPKLLLQDFLAELHEIVVEIPISKGVLLMDTALLVNGVIPVHNGISPLPNSYTGDGVVVGILDSGIYFDHEDFKNEDGSTRIKYIWDQALGSGLNAPAPYGYGEEWSFVDINNGSCNHVEPANQFGHGTTVAGAACGNGRASNDFTGVAPSSDIIAVNIDLSDDNFLLHVVDAIDYVFKKADAMGKPCVINTSIGTYFGSHDGLDLATQMIDALIEERPGRAVVAAAGNGNNLMDSLTNFNPTHLSYAVTPEEQFTYFETSSQNELYFDLWADTASFKEVSFSISNDDTSNFTTLASSIWYSIESFPGNLSNGIYIISDIISPSFELQGILEMYASETEGRYHIEFLITPEDPAHFWRFTTRGIGTFDIWSSAAYQGTANMVYRNLPSSNEFPEIAQYVFPDNKKCIVSSWQCSNKVITVGNYSNRAAYYDIDSVFRLTNEIPGKIFFRSSEGPTRDNRLKPDLCATGNVTMATGNLDFIASALAVNRKRVSYDGLHNTNGGTSMSSPIVAGAVALYLEANPEAWWYETKGALIQSVVRDDFTGNSANTVYGNGKLNAFQYLQFESITGCTDSNSLNYNPLANIDDGSCIDIIEGCTDSTAFNFNIAANLDNGSCIPIIYGCLDSTAVNYNPLANTSNDSCLYSTGIHYLSSSSFSFYPNPINNLLTIHAKTPFKELHLQLLDLRGQLIQEYKVNLANGEATLPIDNVKSGVYLMQIKPVDSGEIVMKKIMKY